MTELLFEGFVIVSSVLGGIVGIIEFGKYLAKLLRKLTDPENPDPAGQGKSRKAPKVPWISIRIPFTKIRISIGKDGPKGWIGAEGAPGTAIGLLQYEYRAARAYLAGGFKAWKSIFVVATSFLEASSTKPPMAEVPVRVVLEHTANDRSVLMSQLEAYLQASVATVTTLVADTGTRPTVHAAKPDCAFTGHSLRAYAKMDTARFVVSANTSETALGKTGTNYAKGRMTSGWVVAPAATDGATAEQMPESLLRLPRMLPTLARAIRQNAQSISALVREVASMVVPTASGARTMA
ncbi:MAG: hypothetical protein ABJP94_23400 [Paracoccaceae bacterium]